LNRKENFISTYKFIDIFLKGYKGNLLLFFISCFFDYFLYIITPIIFGLMLDQIVYYKNISLFLSISSLIIVFLFFYIFLYVHMYKQHDILTTGFIMNVKKKAYEHLLESKSIYFINKKAGEIVTIVNQYSNDCLAFLIKDIIFNLNNLFNVIFCLAYIYIMNVQLGFLISLLIPISVFFSTLLNKKINSLFNNNRVLKEKYDGRIFDLLANFTEIKFLSGEKNAIKIFSFENNKLLDNKLKVDTSINNLKILYEGINLIIQLIIYSLLAMFSYRNQLTIGMISVILIYFFDIGKCLSAIVHSNLVAQERINNIHELKMFLHSESEKEYDGYDDIQITAGQIDFCKVNFSYKKKADILKDLSLSMSPGERIAIVGESGSGKSTLALLLLRFMEIQSGGIFIDNQDITKFSVKSLRRNIGIVQQQILVFPGTLRENITMGKMDVSDEKILDACNRAGLNDFLRMQPEKLDTWISDTENIFSGGQLQMLGIARICLEDPAILIFDEATRGLDKISEAKVLASWENLTQNKTAIMITHKLSNTNYCDRVIVLKAGEIIETGAPNEVLIRSAELKKLFNTGGGYD